MTTDADLIAALRKCERCHNTGTVDRPANPWIKSEWYCPHCRLARMAADRIEAKNRKLAEVDRVLSVEHSLNPNYGWGEWLDEHIRGQE